MRRRNDQGLEITALKAPFPWFGGKSRVADDVWRRFGQVQNYVDTFLARVRAMLEGIAGNG